jgi:alanyl-tRNA synthetase
VVRVVRVFTHDNEIVSIELCGWTHVLNTKDIGCFAIIWQEAVASWVKRITAVVWPKVGLRIHEIQGILDVTVEKLWIKTYTQLADKLDKTLKEYDDMKANLESLETNMIKQILTWSDFSSWKDLDKIFLIPSALNFKNIAFQAKIIFEHQNVLIYTAEWWFILLTKKWISAKEFAAKLGIKWWGTDLMVQGRDESVLWLFK